MFNKILQHEGMRTALMQLLFGVLGALIIQLFLHHQPQIATVNLTGITSSFVKETAKEQLTPVQMKQQVTHFGELVDQSVKQIAKQKGAVLVISEAVVTGCPDYTELLQKKINSGLRQ